eukprot:COSAG06_NODE_56793_length_283_cov_0.766304_1_plen_38_part_10
MNRQVKNDRLLGELARPTELTVATQLLLSYERVSSSAS